MVSIYPVILSGGSGTRLWPLSRSMYPKQFIKFFSHQDQSFLGLTLLRLRGGAAFKPPLILANNDHRFLVKAVVEETGVQGATIMLEPVARNTAPAIAVAALDVLRRDPAGILAIMPSDHVVRDEPQFVDAIQRAAKVAAAGHLVLFGLKPTEPHTGFGYIRQGKAVGDGGAFHVDAFFEKPDAATAQAYLDAGTYFWNSGIFVLPARTFLDELQRLQPAILAAAREALAGATEDLGFVRLDKAAFARAPSISVDYAVMEKTQTAAMLPIDVGWNDVGSWKSLWEIAPRDTHGNYVHGDALLEGARNTYIHSETSLVAAIGVENLIIVDTPDALLVADQSRAQDVSKIVQRLKAAGRKEQESGLRNYRPWGYFETLSLSKRFQVKLLHVAPGAKLSMQMHHHRSEHWIVVQGTARIVIDKDEKLVRENEGVYISATQWHRLENPGKVPLQLIEVQIGSYLGEDDIIRADDVYNRSPDETK